MCGEQIWSLSPTAVSGCWDSSAVPRGSGSGPSEEIQLVTSLEAGELRLGTQPHPPTHTTPSQPLPPSLCQAPALVNMCSKPLLAQEPGCCGCYGWGGGGGLCPRRGNTQGRRCHALGGKKNVGILLRQFKGKTGDAQEKRRRSNTEEGDEGLSSSREQEQRLKGVVGVCP